MIGMGVGDTDLDLDPDLDNSGRVGEERTE